jgi:hydrogenase nickel incorporation protein HypA/HybF
VHELSIALSIIDIATEESKSRNGAAVKAIHLRLGPLSGVVKQALASAFELARECSAMAKSELVIEETPLVVECPKCNQQRTLEGIQDLTCPQCGTPCREIASGRELEIFALEIEEKTEG